MDIARAAARRLSHFDRRMPDPDAVVADPQVGYAIQAEVARLRRERGEAVIELHHFPYRDRGPSAAELIASNGVHAGHVFADAGAATLDDGAARLSIEIDGSEAAAVAGQELTRTVASSLAWLARELPPRGERLQPGQIVLCGTVAPLLPAPDAREVTVTTDRFGSVRCTFA